MNITICRESGLDNPQGTMQRCKYKQGVRDLYVKWGLYKNCELEFFRKSSSELDRRKWGFVDKYRWAKLYIQVEELKHASLHSFRTKLYEAIIKEGGSCLDKN